MTDASEHLARLLDSQYQSLLDEWTLRAGAAPELVAHAPRLLQQLIDDLRGPDASPPSAARPEPPRLFQRGFALRTVIEEYGLLQRVVLESLERSGASVSLGNVRRLGGWFTRAVAHAAAEHERFEAPQAHPAGAALAGAPLAMGGRLENEVADALPGAAPPAANGHAPMSPRERQAAARASQRLHAVLMQAPVAVSVLRGPSFVYEFANSHAHALAARSDLVGSSLLQAFPELTAESPLVQVFEQVYASGKPFSADEFAVPLDRSGDGTIEDAYFNFTCQPVCDDGGQVQDILTVAVDVTSQVLARRRVDALMAELTLADQRKDEFLAMLAHELRNPMAAISTALTLLDQCDGDGVKAARYRETARRQMTNLVRLVDDLLDVARLTRGRVELRKEDVDLAAVVQHALAATRPVIEARQHELTVTLAPGSFRVQADATRLEQVVTNLLTNAAKYTEPGGTISVRLGPAEDGEFAVLSVRDTGRGIPTDMLDNVFGLFTQVSPSIDRSTGGLGLGLTLVKHLVEMHGGSVAAASPGIGKGTEFSVRLPLQPEQGRAAEAAPGKAVERVNQKRKHVVVVEDSEDVRELLKECIEQLGHHVSVARDGLEGVALIESEKPELALIDVGLPGIDGYEVARRVRAEALCGGVRLVALTGYGGADVKQAARDAGFDEHVTKPIEIDRLREVLA